MINGLRSKKKKKAFLTLKTCQFHLKIGHLQAKLHVFFNEEKSFLKISNDF